MKKFKILEKSRFLNNQDMDQLQGGDMSCSTIKIYSMCIDGKFETCGKARAATGFSSESCNGGIYKLCASDMYYAISTCSGNSGYSNTCNGMTTYVKP